MGESNGGVTLFAVTEKVVDNQGTLNTWQRSVHDLNCNDSHLRAIAAMLIFPFRTRLSISPLCPIVRDDCVGVKLGTPIADHQQNPVTRAMSLFRSVAARFTPG